MRAGIENSHYIDNKQKRIRAYNAHVLNDFLLNEANYKNSSVKLRQASATGGQAFGFTSPYSSINSTHTYKHAGNINYQRTGSRISLFTKSKNSSARFAASEPVLSCGVWHTTGKTLHRSARYGVGKFPAMTAQIIHALAGYQGIVGERLQEGSVSNSYAEKDFLFHLTVDRIEALQPLENIKRADNRGLQGQALYDFILERIAASLAKLTELQGGLEDKIGNTQLQQYDSTIVETIRDDIQREKDAITILQENVQRYSNSQEDTSVLSPLLSATGSDSIFHFVTTAAIKAQRDGQKYNQKQTYARGWLRGDLNNAFVDGIRVATNFKVDPHNPVTEKHQGIFGDNTSVAYKIDDISGKRSAKRIAFAIDTLEGAVKLKKLSAKEEKSYAQASYQLTVIGGGKQSYPIAVTSNTKGIGENGIVYTFFKGCAKLLASIPTEAYDLLVGIPFGLAETEAPVSTAYVVRGWLDGERSSIDSPLQNRLAEISKPEKTLSLGAKFGRFVGATVREAVSGVFQSVLSISADLSFRMWRDFYHDQRVSWGAPQMEGAPDALDKELSRLRLGQEIIDAEVKSENKVALVAEQARLQAQHTSFAQADYSLNPGEWRDPLSAMVRGGAAVVEEFTHNVHAKHPLLGLIFTGAYTAGGVAILAPGALTSLFGTSVVLTAYIKGSTIIGNAMAHGKLSSAIGGGFLQAKVAAGIFELLFHRRKSWLAEMGSILVGSPAQAIIYTTMAITAGYFLAYKINVPWLSHHLQEDVGDFAPAALGFAGLKVALVVKDIFEKPHGHQHTSMPRLIEVLTEVYRKNNKIADGKSLTDMQKYEVEEAAAKILMPKNAEALVRMFNDAQQAQQQMSPQEANDIYKGFERVQIMQKMQQDKDLLPHLSSRTKRDYLAYLQTKHHDTPEILDAMYDAMHPSKEESTIKLAAMIPFRYITLGLRSIPALFTWGVNRFYFKNTTPRRNLVLRQMGKKISKDVARVGNAVGKGAKTVVKFLRQALFAPLFDVAVNSIAARTETALFGTHNIAQASYSVSTAFDEAFEYSKQTLGQPVDALKREALKPNAAVIAKREMRSAANRVMEQSAVADAKERKTRPAAYQPNKLDQKATNDSLPPAYSKGDALNFEKYQRILGEKVEAEMKNNDSPTEGVLPNNALLCLYELWRSKVEARQQGMPANALIANEHLEELVDGMRDNAGLMQLLQSLGPETLSKEFRRATELMNRLHSEAWEKVYQPGPSAPFAGQANHQPVLQQQQFFRPAPSPREENMFEICKEQKDNVNLPPKQRQFYGQQYHQLRTMRQYNRPENFGRTFLHGVLDVLDEASEVEWWVYNPQTGWLEYHNGADEVIYWTARGLMQGVGQIAHAAGNQVMGVAADAKEVAGEVVDVLAHRVANGFAGVARVASDTLHGIARVAGVVREGVAGAAIDGAVQAADVVGDGVVGAARIAYHGASLFGNTVARGVDNIEADTVECCIDCVRVTAHVACGVGHVLGGIFSAFDRL